MKANQKFILRKITDDNDSTIHISRLLAITIPIIIVTASHMLYALGVDVPELLLEPVFDLILVVSGVAIAIVGLKLGFGVLAILLLVMWACFAYIYFTYVLNLV